MSGRCLDITAHAYLVSHLLHRLLVRLGCTTLMVTQNSDLSVSMIICVELLLEARVFEIFIVEKSLEGDRSIESTEDLRS